MEVRHNMSRDYVYWGNSSYSDDIFKIQKE